MGKLLFCFLLVLGLSPLAVANPWTVNFEALPQEAGFQKALENFWTHFEAIVTNPGPEDLAALKAAQSEGRRLSAGDQENKELLLFDNLASFYLQEDFSDTKGEGGDPFRLAWQQGLFLLRDGEVQRAAENMSALLTQQGESWDNAPFLLDCSEIFFAAGMYTNSRRVLNRAGELWQESPENFPLNTLLRDKVSSHDPERKLEKKQLHLIQKRGSSVGIYSSYFDIFVPIKREWDIQTYDYSDRSSLLMFMPEKEEEPSGRILSYTFSMEIELPERSGFTHFMEKRLDDFKKKKQIDMEGLPREALVYEVWDPDKAAGLGGLKGVYVFLEAPLDKQRWAWGEEPNIALSSSPVLQTLPYEGTAYYAFFLDTAGVMYEESHKEFSWFLQGIHWPVKG